MTDETTERTLDEGTQATAPEEEASGPPASEREEGEEAAARAPGEEAAGAPAEEEAAGEEATEEPAEEEHAEAGTTGDEATEEPAEEEPAGEEATEVPATEVEVRSAEEPAPAPEDDEPLTIAGREFSSRLIVGTGKYEDNQTMVEAIRASGAEMVTVAVRRVDLDQKEESILAHLDTDEVMLLANTAGCYTAEEAIRYARLARSAGFNEWLKLEVIGDEETLLPDVRETVEAAETLTDEGFKVLAYTNEDVVTALRLEDAGCVAVMPLASPIGSGLGLLNPYYIREMKRRLDVPVIVDAGVGTASDACETMEQGVDGVLMNTAIARAEYPVAMARAMKKAIEAGRLAFLAGRMERREIAMPSSPTRGMLD